MHRVITLLEKIRELQQKEDIHTIDVDLMLDYTKVLYADLLELRNKLHFKERLDIPSAPDNAYIASGMEENHRELEESRPTSAPAIELDINTARYESPPAPEANNEPEAAGPGPAPQVSTTSFHADRPQSAAFRDMDVRRLIGINDKYLFISELFGNNKEGYEEVIDHINGFETEEEALAWINTEVFDKYHWNEEQEAVQSFYQTLGDYFASR
ncbi:MAG: hypothetical protein EOP49_14070 [Sphingobacteriales bacterium]|nr:MAG: hypothetical protein EOP49_14070 [Sphingobacteriales bacterium]